MKILFDLSASQPDKDIINHGGSEYTKAVFIKLIEYFPRSVSVIYNKCLEPGNYISELVQNHSIDTLERNDAKFLCNYIKENQINVFYTALSRKEYIPLIKMQSETFKVILTIHGLRALELPSDKFEWRYSHSVRSKIKYIYKQVFPTAYKKSILKHFRRYLGASRIITVSDYSKKSLLTFFPELSADRISVFYSPLLNYSIDDNSGTELMSSLSIISRKYFIIISGSLWIKNSFRAIKSFDELISNNSLCKDYKMVITGFKNHQFKVKNTENFVFTDYLNRNSLEHLFKNARALVYPTLNEGFGYPPLEAMKYGVPVLASDIGPIREVCGNAVNYFSPVNESEIKIQLFDAMSNLDLFSETNLQIRYNRYKIIRGRQEDDLNNMIKVLTQ